jgi:type IV pilus assembly protein PilW
VSLIETMVGITVGLLVVLAAIGTLMITRQSSNDVSDSYRMATAGNLTMRLIEYTVRQAGAAELDQPSGVGTSVSFGDMTMRAASATGDQLVSGTEGGTSPDTLTVSYQHRANGVTRDCLGSAPTLPTGATTERIDNFFSVTTTELRCKGQRGSDGTDIESAQALVGDNSNTNTEIQVEDFQVWYWLQDATGQQQRRVTATNVAANGGWPAVVAVEVCLQLHGTRADYPSANFNNCQGTSTANGGRLHQVFRGTYMLRNRI